MRAELAVAGLLLAVPGAAAAPDDECRTSCLPQPGQCDLVTVSTSWQYPYVYVVVHDECLAAGTPDASSP